MISHLFFYYLVLLAMVWLFILLYLAGPGTTSVSLQRPVGLEPITPKRKRSAEPKPFVGLTHKPSCPLCASEGDPVRAPTPARPAPMALIPRRPRVIDTSQHFCPHEGCDYRGWLGL